jgi:hypothetical protein
MGRGLWKGGRVWTKCQQQNSKNETVVCSSVRERVTILFKKKTDLNIDTFFLLKKLWAWLWITQFGLSPKQLKKSPKFRI